MEIVMYFWLAKNDTTMIILQAQSGGGISSAIFFLCIFSIMFFFFIRPAQKKQKAQDLFTDELSKGSEVVTTSGIIGRITKIEDGEVQLQVDQKTFLRVVKGAISKDMTEQLHKTADKA